MNEIIKFTDTEMQSIVKLQTDYQQHLITLGQLELEKIDLEQQLDQNKIQRSQVLENWKQSQKEEESIINSLSQKYGDGSLNLKDGTFKPISK